MSKHTKGPWIISHDDKCNLTDIIAQGDVDIATLPEYMDYEQREANAKRIVTCVNIHDELLAALKELRTQIFAHHKMSVKKDYSLLLAVAAADKVLNKAEGRY